MIPAFPDSRDSLSDAPDADIAPADAQNTHQGHVTPLAEGEPRQPKTEAERANRRLSEGASVPEGGAGYES